VAEIRGTHSLGTLVASPNIRHPVPFARELTALDDISGGRFTLGVGSGSDGDYDSRVFGERGRLAGRTRRFGEFGELHAHPIVVVHLRHPCRTYAISAAALGASESTTSTRA
jgi:hypothetical protein